MPGRKFGRKLQNKQIGKVYTSSKQLCHAPCQRVSLAGSRRRCPVERLSEQHPEGAGAVPMAAYASVAQ